MFEPGVGGFAEVGQFELRELGARGAEVLEMGQRVVQEWRGQPVWVIRRSEETVSALDALNDQLKDPQSEQDQQPAYASSLWRSKKKREKKKQA